LNSAAFFFFKSSSVGSTSIGSAAGSGALGWGLEAAGLLAEGFDGSGSSSTVADLRGAELEELEDADGRASGMSVSSFNSFLSPSGISFDPSGRSKDCYDGWSIRLTKAF
jgi:hypothetical protein